MSDKKPVWPRIGELTALIKALKPQILDDYRAYPDEFSEEEENAPPSMLVTIGADGESPDSWSYQTGDNSYSGGAYLYPFWGVVAIHRRSNSRKVAREIIEDLNGSYPW